MLVALHPLARAIIFVSCALSAMACYDRSSLPPAPDATDVPPELPCDGARVPGDGKWGRQCWNPPEDYCKDGIVPSNDWYCKPDGSKCCQGTSSTCFLCGWWHVTRAGDSVQCIDYAALPPVSDAQCDQFSKILWSLSPLRYQCIGLYDVWDLKPCKELLDDPECKVDVSEDKQFCP
jgi:hypothetical protein